MNKGISLRRGGAEVWNGRRSTTKTTPRRTTRRYHKVAEYRPTIRRVMHFTSLTANS